MPFEGLGSFGPTDTGKSVLGVRLGAQLIARAMGAEVYPNPEKEIGWWPVRCVEGSNGTAFIFPSTLDVFHWHGDTFELPVGTTHLAESDGCENQAFCYDRRVIALQFHLETTRESARKLIADCRDELIPGRFVQSEAEILSAPIDRYQIINEHMSEALSFRPRADETPH